MTCEGRKNEELHQMSRRELGVFYRYHRQGGLLVIDNAMQKGKSSKNIDDDVVVYKDMRSRFLHEAEASDRIEQIGKEEFDEDFLLEMRPINE